MRSERRAIHFLGFVKISVRSRSPQMWGWEVYKDGSDAPVRRSETTFRYADDAWQAGRHVLAELEATPPPAARRVERQEAA